MTSSTKEDFECLPGPSDGITDVAWSPTADYLAVASWDTQVRVYEVNSITRATVAKAAVAHEGPVFSVCWSPDGTKLASVGADKSIRVLDVASGQTIQQQNAHDAPIRACKWTLVNNQNSILVTGGWDKQVKYWMVGPGGLQPMGSLLLPERCFAMDCIGSLLVIGTAERHAVIVDLATNPMQPATAPAGTPLKMQTRAISCFPDGKGYAVGSVEGRIAVQNLDPTKQSSNFAFKCHREGTVAYGVNSIKFHPKFTGTFASAGSDGVISFWDKESKQRLESFPSPNVPIAAMDFNRDGNLLAYAISYDWSCGHEQYNPNGKNAVMIHRLHDTEVRPRSSAFRRR